MQNEEANGIDLIHTQIRLVWCLSRDYSLEFDSSFVRYQTTMLDAVTIITFDRLSIGRSDYIEYKDFGRKVQYLD